MHATKLDFSSRASEGLDSERRGMDYFDQKAYIQQKKNIQSFNEINQISNFPHQYATFGKKDFNTTRISQERSLNSTKQRFNTSFQGEQSNRENYQNADENSYGGFQWKFNEANNLAMANKHNIRRISTAKTGKRKNLNYSFGGIESHLTMNIKKKANPLQNYKYLAKNKEMEKTFNKLVDQRIAEEFIKPDEDRTLFNLNAIIDKQLNKQEHEIIIILNGSLDSTYGYTANKMKINVKDQPQENLLQRRANFQKFLDACSVKLKQNVVLKHAFLADGTPVHTLSQIPEDDYCLFVSQTPIFLGIRKANSNSNITQVITNKNNTTGPLINLRPLLAHNATNAPPRQMVNLITRRQSTITDPPPSMDRHGSFVKKVKREINSYGKDILNDKELMNDLVHLSKTQKSLKNLLEGTKNGGNKNIEDELNDTVINDFNPYETFQVQPKKHKPIPKEELIVELDFAPKSMNFTGSARDKELKYQIADGSAPRFMKRYFVHKRNKDILKDHCRRHGPMEEKFQNNSMRSTSYCYWDKSKLLSNYVQNQFIKKRLIFSEQRKRKEKNKVEIAKDVLEGSPRKLIQKSRSNSPPKSPEKLGLSPYISKISTYKKKIENKFFPNEGGFSEEIETKNKDTGERKVDGVHLSIVDDMLQKMVGSTHGRTINTAFLDAFLVIWNKVEEKGEDFLEYGEKDLDETILHKLLNKLSKQEGKDITALRKSLNTSKTSKPSIVGQGEHSLRESMLNQSMGIDIENLNSENIALGSPRKTGKNYFKRKRLPERGSMGKRLERRKNVEEGRKSMDATQTMWAKDKIVRAIQDGYQPLYRQNIPRLQIESSFTRNELHDLYSRYKALCQITATRNPGHTVKDGIDFQSFYHGMTEFVYEDKELIRKIFLFAKKTPGLGKGFLDWSQFLQAIKILRVKQLNEKIDLFFKIIDSDGNGFLNWDEARKICKLSVSKLGSNSEKYPDLQVDFLAQNFTKFVFDAVGCAYDENIPLSSIKNEILKEGKNKDILCMFCGADNILFNKNQISRIQGSEKE